MCGLDRNILLFPKGTKPTDVRCLSLFLNVPDAEQQPINWGRKAYFKLTVINQKQPSRSVSKGASCKLSAHSYLASDEPQCASKCHEWPVCLNGTQWLNLSLLWMLVAFLSDSSLGLFSITALPIVAY